MSFLAEKYYFGIGTRVDYAKAIYWSKKGADANITYCHYLYGHMLYYGTSKQIDKNLGLMHLRIAAETGHQHAMLLTARILINTSGKKESIEEGVAFLIKLASQGSADAQFDLGYQYSLGKNVQVDYKKSMRWYKKASEQCHVGALYNLASMYHCGNAIKQDIDKAIELYELAGQNGMDLACRTLKDVYSEGSLVPKDLSLAAYWEKEASRIKREAEVKKPPSLENIFPKLSTGVSNSRRQRLAEKRSLSRKGSEMLEHIDIGEN